jgi:hypothetical protein
MRRIGNSDEDAVHDATASLINMGTVGRGKLNRSLLMLNRVSVIVAPGHREPLLIVHDVSSVHVQPLHCPCASLTVYRRDLAISVSSRFKSPNTSHHRFRLSSLGLLTPAVLLFLSDLR